VFVGGAVFQDQMRAQLLTLRNTLDDSTAELFVEGTIGSYRNVVETLSVV
jgi:hypothetical protein